MEIASPRPAARPLPPALPYLALLGAMASFYIGTTVAKQLFPEIGASGAIAYRIGFSAIILGLIVRPWRAGMDRSGLVAVMRYGAVLGVMDLYRFCAGHLSV